MSRRGSDNDQSRDTKEDQNNNNDDREDEGEDEGDSGQQNIEYYDRLVCFGDRIKLRNKHGFWVVRDKSNLGSTSFSNITTTRHLNDDDDLDVDFDHSIVWEILPASPKRLSEMFRGRKYPIQWHDEIVLRDTTRDMAISPTGALVSAHTLDPDNNRLLKILGAIEIPRQSYLALSSERTESIVCDVATRVNVANLHNVTIPLVDKRTRHKKLIQFQRQVLNSRVKNIERNPSIWWRITPNTTNDDDDDDNGNQQDDDDEFIEHNFIAYSDGFQLNHIPNHETEDTNVLFAFQETETSDDIPDSCQLNDKCGEDGDLYVLKSSDCIQPIFDQYPDAKYFEFFLSNIDPNIIPQVPICTACSGQECHSKKPNAGAISSVCTDPHGRYYMASLQYPVMDLLPPPGDDDDGGGGDRGKIPPQIPKCICATQEPCLSCRSNRDCNPNSTNNKCIDGYCQNASGSGCSIQQNAVLDSSLSSVDSDKQKVDSEFLRFKNQREHVQWSTILPILVMGLAIAGLLLYFIIHTIGNQLDILKAKREAQSTEKTIQTLQGGEGGRRQQYSNNGSITTNPGPFVNPTSSTTTTTTSILSPSQISPPNNTNTTTTTNVPVNTLSSMDPIPPNITITRA